MKEIAVVLVALYRYMNFPVRIMQSLLENVGGVKSYTVFFKNCQTNVFNYPTAREEELFISCINKLRPKLVGFSVLSPYLPIAKRLTRLIKNNTSSLVIWGGIHPTILPESCVNDADILCIGEGEGAITDLARSLREDRSYYSINNLWARDGDCIIKNPLRPLIQDLDSVPFPSYGNDSYYFIDSNTIKRKDPLLYDHYLFVQSSRGCPYVCSYCVNSLLHPLFENLGPYVRRRSVRNVIREIKENLRAQDNRINYVHFVDETFGSEEAWLKEFQVQYKEEIGLPFYVEYNPKSINPDVLSRLAKSGLDVINFGIQTGSDYIRNNIFHRPGKNKEIINLANDIASYSIRIKYDLMLDNPYDTEQSLKDTIEFLLQLPKPLFFNLFSLQYFPNYPITKKAIEDKHILPEEAGIETLINKTIRNWAFVPRVFPCSEKQILQNVIWLIVNNHARDDIVRFSVFGHFLISKLCLIYLNLKSIVLGKILGVGGVVWRSSWLPYLVSGVSYILKGDFKIFLLKIRKYLRIR